MRLSVLSATAVLAGFCLLLIGCQPSTNRIDPKAPAATYATTRMEIRNEKYASTVNVPVSIALADVERQLNTYVSGLIYEDNSLEDNNNDQFQTKIFKRAPIGVRAGLVNGDSLFYFVVPLRIWAKTGLTVLGFTKYQETNFEIDLRFATRFSIDRDWSVSTQTRAEGYDWIKKPTTNFVGLNLPITGLVASMIDKNLGAITATLDQQVRRQIDLKTPVLQAWNLIREPYLVSEPYRTWLLVVPKRILITPLRFEKGQIRASIGIEGYTLTQIGAKPVVRPALTLPDLTVVPQVPDDFRVGILSEVSYAEAARLAAEQFVGKTFTFREGRNSVTITSLELYGQDETLIIKAGLTGTITGDIYLRGRPYYDAASKTISLKDLAYDLDTKNVLFKTANWLLHGAFAKTLQQQLTIPVGEQIDAIRGAVQTELNNRQLAKGVVLTGRIDDVRPDQVYLTPTTMLAVVYANGHVTVNVDGL